MKEKKGVSTFPSHRLTCAFSCQLQHRIASMVNNQACKLLDANIDRFFLKGGGGN